MGLGGARESGWGLVYCCFLFIYMFVLLLILMKRKNLFYAAGFKPRRSIVFASWSAGDFGIVGATEWLEVRTN